MKAVFEFNLGLISKYRSELMGVATIGILMCHAQSYDVNLPFHLDSVLAFGQIGVVLFFFLSGIGSYYSTRKINNMPKDILTWYRKRFVRLLIPYILVYGAYLLISDLSWPQRFYYLSTISYWFGDGGAWFICMLWPIYLITPLWNLLLEKVKYPIIPTIAIMAIMMLVKSSLSGAFNQASLFFAGFWLARYVKRELTLPSKWMVIIVSIVISLLALYYICGIGYLIFILFVPALLLFCKIIDVFKNTFVNKMLSFFGGISLESYLFNTTLIAWIDRFHLLPGALYVYRYAFIVVFGIFISWLINRLCQPIISKLSNKL